MQPGWGIHQRWSVGELPYILQVSHFHQHPPSCKTRDFLLFWLAAARPCSLWAPSSAEMGCKERLMLLRHLLCGAAPARPNGRMEPQQRVPCYTTPLSLRRHGWVVWAAGRTAPEGRAPGVLGLPRRWGKQMQGEHPPSADLSLGKARVKSSPLACTGPRRSLFWLGGRSFVFL